jgi:tripartite-type tricarboxylate transporter receptor subunit TctC
MISASRRAFLQRALSAAAPATLLAFSGNKASAQPTAMKIVVPVSAGSALDYFTRMLAEEMSRRFGRTIVIENRPGGATLVGTQAVARASPDGNTLLANAPPAFVIAPHLRRLDFDPLSSLEPICKLVRFPTIIVVHGASPYHTLADLLNGARAKPDELTLASIGPASLTRIGFEMLMRAADVKMTFVPYAAPALAVNDLLGQHVVSYFGNYTDASGQLRAGSLRALAVASRARIDLLPGVPTIAESGYPDFEVEGWFGLFAPARTPKQTLSDLATSFAAAIREPTLRDKLASVALYPDEMGGDELRALIRKQYDEFAAIIREAHITAE